MALFDLLNEIFYHATLC